MGRGDCGLRRAVFLDRDGVIVEPVPDPRLGTFESPYEAAGVSLVPGAVDGIRALREAGWLLIGASNQPAAAKGTSSLEALEAVHARLLTLLAENDASLDDWRYCFHHPQGTTPGLSGPCDCRKPGAGLLRSAAADNGVDLTASWMVGDSDTDVSAGESAGTWTVLIEHPRTAHRRQPMSSATLITPDLLGASEAIENTNLDSERPLVTSRSSGAENPTEGR